MNEYLKNYYQNNKEKYRKSARVFYANHKKKVLKERKEFYEKNKLDVIGQQKKYYIKNRDKILNTLKEKYNKDKKREYYLKNKEILSNKSKIRYQKDIEGNRKKSKEYYYKNKERDDLKIKERNRLYAKNNKDKISIYFKNKRKTDIQFRINRNVTSAVSKALIKNPLYSKTKWQKYIGYTIKDLMIHLEKQFNDKMSWDNYGTWHIDHIIPQTHFKYTFFEDEDFKKCWALSNLQPLDAIENIKKGNRIC